MKILCSGCSFTYGGGFTEEERQSKIWPTLLENKLNQTLNNKVTVNNIAAPGLSNLEIFLRTLQQLQSQHYDTVIVQWTAFRRYWFEPSINNYYMCAGQSDLHLEDWKDGLMYLTKEQRKTFHRTLMMLSGDFKSTVDQATFCQTLVDIKKHNQQLVFVNGILPWTKDLFEVPQGDFDMAEYFQPFTYNLFDVENQPAADVLEKYKKLSASLTVNQQHWVNISESWRKNQLDVATAGHHPGPLSHAWMCDQILDHLQRSS